MTSQTANIAPKGLAYAMIAATAFVAATLLAPQRVNAADVTETFSAHTQDSTQTVDHSAWSKLLGKYVKADASGLNSVNYAAFKSADHATLKTYISELQKVNPAQLSRNEQFAFWANLYNAKTIDIILDHYPVKSIKDITLETGFFSALKKSVGAGGPWKTPVVTVTGTKLSLNDIENEILRATFKDPRVHYAVNCASIGCPNLGQTAFIGTDLNSQLDAAAKAFINHPRGISADAGKITASSIFSWFKADFGGNAQGVLAHVKKYASSDLKAKIEAASGISGYDYNWSLNDTAN